jgi:hypothetical protein
VSTLDPNTQFEHFDPRNSEDLVKLVQMPWFWRALPNDPGTARYVIDAIASGDAPYVAGLVPPGVLELINKQRNEMGKAPLGETPSA